MSTESARSAVECASSPAPSSPTNITALMQSTTTSTRRWRSGIALISQQSCIGTIILPRSAGPRRGELGGLRIAAALRLQQEHLGHPEKARDVERLLEVRVEGEGDVSLPQKVPRISGHGDGGNAHVPVVLTPQPPHEFDAGLAGHLEV